MPTVDIKDLSGATVGSLELDDSVWGADPNDHLLWEAVKWQRAKARSGTASSLRPSEVRGTGKKPYRQKGTGNARRGMTRGAHHVGGGRVFGPKPRDYEYALPKKVRKAALRVALSERVREQKVIVLDGDQWLLGKSMPGFCPVGPWLVTADELDPRDLRLGCTIGDIARTVLPVRSTS